VTEGENVFENWARRAPQTDADAVPAATVILLRERPGAATGSTERPGGIETLMLRRSSKLAFAGGMWVFPGGRVDPGDWEQGADRGALAASRRAAVREAEEEAGLVVLAESLVTLSHWTPPPQVPKRFATWFFLAPAPEGPVKVDGAEIREHVWTAPADALVRRDRGEIELAPPTWVTLHRLSAYGSVSEALEETRRSAPEIYATRFSLAEAGAVALWSGDAGYESSDYALAGARHRLWMLESGWRYERSDDAVVPTGEP
jgi:8-oxo-dGTP pyrophosphatase MutT (NUDIX family)